MTEVYNISSSKIRRRTLRRRCPVTETLLWSKIRNRQLDGLKFKRQYSIGHYVIDFYCPEKKLAIEIDGDSHFNPKAKQYDKEREEYIKSFGVIFLRFTNKDITENINGVIEVVSKI